MLVVSDSSTLSFPFRSDREELGYVGPKTTKTGFDIHPSIFLDATSGGVYGIGGLEILRTSFIKTEADKAAQQQQRKDRWKTPFELKERYKWFTSPVQAISNAPQAAGYTLIGDRESDIYDLIARTRENNWDFLYRSKTNRRLSEQEQATTLYATLDRWQVEFEYEFLAQATKKRSKHKAEVQVKFGSVCIARPKSHPNKDLAEQIPLYVVQVKEKAQSVVGKEEPIHWILITSHPVNTPEQALQIIKWYQWRWTIEQLFRTLKIKGLNIEASEVETFHALSNLTTLALLAAVQIMQLVQAREGQTDQQMKDVFFEQEQQCLILLNEKLQGNTPKSQNPFPPDSLAFASWVIARLGGWKGYKKSRPPGPITMTRGLNKFYNILQGYYLLL